MFLNSSQKPLNRLKARDAPGLEDLDGVGLQLVVASKTFVEADHALGLLLCHSTLMVDSLRPEHHAVQGFA
jgi:hypothetical protein